MAAVFALLIVPLVLGAGMFLGLTGAEHSLAAGAAGAMFFALSAFVIGGALKVVATEERDADEEARRSHA